MRGRPPKPTRLRILEGNRGRRPLNQHEPRPPVGVPKMPRWLGKGAQQEWRRGTKLLKPLGLLTLADGMALALYCVAVEQLQWAEATLAQEGRTIVTPKGCTVPHPAISIGRGAAEQVRKLGALFGLDPSSRSRLSVPEPADAEDPFLPFLDEASRPDAGPGGDSDE